MTNLLRQLAHAASMTDSSGKAGSERRSYVTGQLVLIFGPTRVLGSRSELLEELLILQVVLLNLLDALFTENEALRRFEDLSLDDERGLPALEPLLWAREFECLRPHAVYVLEVVLQTLDDFFLLVLLQSQDVFDILALLNFTHLLDAVLYLLLSSVQFLCHTQQVSDFVELLIFVEREGLVSDSLVLHLVELVERESA